VIVGVVLIVVGGLAIIFRRTLAPYTQGSLGATGEMRRKVERSWAVVGAIAIGAGLSLLVS